MAQMKTNTLQSSTCKKYTSSCNESAIQYQEKLQGVLQLNMKLKELYQIMKNNNLSKKIQMNQKNQSKTQSMQLTTIKKQESKIQNENQQLVNNLNYLISQNGKLKAQVDLSRNSRVIYSNIYKNLQKQIKKQQHLYREAIIGYLQYQQVEYLLDEKINKAVKKLQKEVNDLQSGFSKVVKKKEKKNRMSRLDTGIKSVTQKAQSLSTSRGAQQQCKLFSKRSDKISQSALKSKQSKLPLRQQSMPDTIKHQQKSTKKLDVSNKNTMAENPFASTSYTTQKQVSVDSYQLSMESEYYANVMKHLKQISELQEIQQISDLWQNIDEEIQSQYNQYLQYEEKIKEAELEEQKLLKALQIQQANSQGIKTVQEQQLQKIVQQMEKQAKLIEENQLKLTQLIDINTHKLNEEEIHHHVERIKRKGQTNNRQLQKLLQNVRKQKNDSKNLKTSRTTQR